MSSRCCSNPALISAMALMLGVAAPAARGQVFPFTSGPIPLCDTSIFTSNVAGVGQLVTPGQWNWGAYLDNVLLNITSDHPQTLQISLTSPAGTTLVLSAFNGAGGQNYTNTSFPYWGGANINTAAAPFTGSYWPEGGTLNVFSGEWADGTWTITVIDTSCVNGGTGPNGTWGSGWFTGGSGTGAFSFGFSSPPPPCIIDMGWINTGFCPGGTADVLSGFENNWWWDPSATVSVYFNGFQAVPDPYAVNVQGSYNIEVLDFFNGCTYFGTVNVTSSPWLNLGPDIDYVSCNAPSANLPSLFNTTGGAQTWSLNGQWLSVAQASNATQPGTYQLILNNPGNCGDTALVNLSFGAGNVLGPDQTVSICPDESADLTALFNTAGLQAEWTFNGAPFSTPQAADLPGDYLLTVTTQEGCSDDALVSLLVEAAPDLGPDQQVSVCSNAVLDLTNVFASAGLFTTWTFNLGTVPDPTAVSAPGDYQLTASNAAGCSDAAIATLSALAAPQLGADAQGSICTGSTFNLTAAINASGLSASWSMGATIVPDPTSVSTPGFYLLIATNAALCNDTAVVNLAVLPNPALGPDQQVTACDNTTVDLSALYATGSNAASWTLNGASVADASSVTAAGAYVLTATSPAGCSSTATATVQFNSSPNLGGDTDASVCAGDSLDLTALFPLAGLTSSWTLSGAAIADPISAVASGSYQVVAANAFSCTDTARVSFTVNPNPQLGPDQAYTLCPWQSVDLSAVFPVNGLNTTYTLDGIAVDDPTAVADSGAFLVVAIDSFGCADSAFAFVDTMACVCAADFAFEGRCIQEPMRLTLLADSSIIGAQWDFGGFASPSTAIDPVTLMNAEGEVVVTLIAAMTCGVDTIQRAFRVYDCTDSCSIWIPNAFTPNNDDENDAWAWVGECEPEEFKVMVFNRWGELIYQTDDPEKKWDGTYNGVLSQDGVYLYRAFYKLPYQEERSVIGHVTLLR